MRAVVHADQLGLAGLKLVDNYPDPQPQANEVVVKLKYAGLNHHDLFVINGNHTADKPPVVPAADGAGVVEAVGSAVTNWQPGDEVVVNPLLWGQKLDVPPVYMGILGYPQDGTLADKVCVPENQLGKKPAYLSWEEAGVLSLSALTAYRDVFRKAQVKAGERVLIPGVGGAVATYMVLFAKSCGAHVIVTSRSQEKLDQAKQLGADEFLLDSDDWLAETPAVDVVIDDVGPATFNRSLAQLRFEGRLVTFGSSTGDELTLNLRDLFFNQLQVIGSTGGSQEEFAKMLELVEAHQWHPVVDTVYPLADVAAGYQKMMDAKQSGNIAVKVED